VAELKEIGTIPKLGHHQIPASLDTLIPILLELELHSTLWMVVVIYNHHALGRWVVVQNQFGVSGSTECSSALVSPVQRSPSREGDGPLQLLVISPPQLSQPWMSETFAAEKRHAPQSHQSHT
jgi:hypothetical protein